MGAPRLTVVDGTDAPADLNGLVRFAERRNLAYACVPSHLKRSLAAIILNEQSRTANTLGNRMWEFGGDVAVCCYTYLLTPGSRVLLEKLTGSAASQEIPHIFGTRRFITVPTSARHLSLS